MDKSHDLFSKLSFQNSYTSIKSSGKNISQIKDLKKNTSQRYPKNLNSFKTIRIISDKNPEKIRLNQKSKSKIQNEEVSHDQIKVVVRFRPLNIIEEQISKKNAGEICVNIGPQNTVLVSNPKIKPVEFSLDKIFPVETSQATFYKEVIEGTIKDVIKGYNGTIIAYGQSGSGKTYSMYGNSLGNDELKGIVPRSIEQILNHIKKEQNDIKYLIRFSIFEIYKEQIFDLLCPETKSSELKIKEDPVKGTYVDNLTLVSIEDEEEFLALIETANQNKSISQTKLNQNSSRSHVVLMVRLKQKINSMTEKQGVLNLVDLAGSEKISKTGAIGETLEEAKKINTSLSALGNVINALTSANKEFVPYRDSKLTRILKDSLGGNFKTSLIVTCSPHSYNLEETISTLNFAKRAKFVKNTAKINIKRSPEQLEKIILQLEEKIMSLNQFESIRSERNIVSLITEENENLKINSFNNFSDFEVTRLKDDIENLTNENKLLKNQIEELKRCVNYEDIIRNLEESVKQNLKEIENISKFRENFSESQLKEENELLRNSNIYLKNELLEKNYVRMKNSGSLDKLYDSKNNEHIIDDFLSKINSRMNDDLILKSYESTIKLAKLTFFNSNEFTSKTQISQSYKNEVENLFFTFKKVINDLISQISIDLMNYRSLTKFSEEITNKFNNLNKYYQNYLEYIDELKNFKRNQSCTCINQTQENEPFKRKFIRKISNRLTKRFTGAQLLTNILEKMTEKEIELVRSSYNQGIESHPVLNLQDRNSFDTKGEKKRNESQTTKGLNPRSSFDLKDEMQELKILRAENQNNRNLIYNMTNEIAELQVKIVNYEKIMNLGIKNEESTTNEVFSLKSTPNETKKKKFLDLNDIESKSQRMEGFRSVLERKIERLNKNEPKELGSIADSLLGDLGLASRKMDYVLLEFKNGFDENDFKMTYGTGINATLLTKGPVMRILKKLNGDTNSKVNNFPEDN